MAILVASDLGYRSTTALRRGLRLGETLGLAVEIAHVVDGDLPAGLRDQAAQWARSNLRAEAEAHPGPAPTLTVLTGRAKHEIVRHAAKTSSDLIVVGQHDRRKDGPFGFADTTAGHIVRASHLPVLLASCEAREPYRSAIVAVDFSIYARSALRNAFRFLPGAELVALHAFQVPFRNRLGTPEVVEAIEAEAEQGFRRFVEEELVHFLAGEPGPLPPLERVVAEGTPADVIRREQARRGAELIVIGTHGQPALLRVLWGSVAADLLDDPPCDLLIVHGMPA